MINSRLALGLLCVFILLLAVYYQVSLLLSLLIIILMIKNNSLEQRLSQLEKKLFALLNKEKMNQPALGPSLAEKNINATHVTTPLIKSTAPTTPTQANTSPDSWMMTKIKSFLFSGNMIAKIGIIILFFGAVFLFKYTIEHSNLSIELRLCGAILAGIALIAIGWWLSSTRKNYANILQGGGIGLIYLTIYAAFAFYQLLPITLAFVLLLLIITFAGIISILQNAKPLAIFGILGGFLAPVLLTTTEGNYITLFFYYAILNIAIFSIAWKKYWHDLSLIGFIFTFIISALWGYQSYQAAYFVITELFLIFFFLLYTAIAVLYTTHQQANQKNYINTVLTFGTPVIVFSLQAALVKNSDYGLAWTSFSLCCFYAALAYIIYFFRINILRHLQTAFTALAVTFGTITIPCTLSNIWTMSSWALESIVVLWFGQRQNQLLTRLGAAIILFASTILFIWDMPAFYNKPLFNDFYLSGILVVIANLTCAYLFYKEEKNGRLFEKMIATIFFIVGSISWYALNLIELNNYVNPDYLFITTLLFISSSSLAFWMLSEHLMWSWLRYLALLLLPMLLLLSIKPQSFWLYHIPELLLVWIYSFSVLYTMLYRHDRFKEDYLKELHLVSFLFLVLFMTAKVDFYMQQFFNLPLMSTWRFLIWGIIPSCVLYILSAHLKMFSWPLVRYATSYRVLGGIVLFLFVSCWFLFSNTFSGNIHSLLYFPLLNPLDVTIAIALGSLAYWTYSTWQPLTTYLHELSLKLTLGLFCIFIFIWLNAMLLRTISYWTITSYSLIPLWQSVLVQACFSILWTLLALITTFIATRIKQRELWFYGVGLIGVVVVKLFLIDLSGADTLSRVITFIGVGILLLINGYISPLPPKKN